MTQSTPSEALAHLSRLASKPEVRATLILSRSDGAIVHSTGLASASAAAAPPLDESSSVRDGVEDGQDVEARAETEAGTAPEIARTIFDLVNAAGALAGGLAAAEDTGFPGTGSGHALDDVTAPDYTQRQSSNSSIDDVQLLRVRTRKGEAVVVPDAKYLLVVIHNGPKTT